MNDASTTTLHPEAVSFDVPAGSDQRRIGLLFATTGLVLFVLMAFVGLVLRLNQGEAISISDDWFYRLMTLHAPGMIAGTLLAMAGGLWYVVKAAVPDLSTGRAMAAWWLTVGGVVLVLVAILIGGFGAAWTFLYPLPFQSAGMWSDWATVLFLVGMGLVGTSFTVFCIDMLKTVTERYGGFTGAMGVKWLLGRSSEAPPPPAIAAAAVSLQGIIAGAVGMTILIALIDRVIDSSITIDPLWAKDLTYFFGHTVANLIIYLAAGMLYALVPLYAGRQWKTTKPIVYGWLGTLAFVLTAYGHHLYMDFVQPMSLNVIGLVASSAAAIPVAVVTVYTAMVLIWGSKYRWNLTSAFFFLGFIGWALGGIGAVIDSAIPVNFHFHNTLWVPAHFHGYMLMGVSLWVMGLVSYLLERASGRAASKKVALFGPVAAVIGGWGLVYIWYVSGALGVPRRWSVQPDGTAIWSLIGSIFAIIFLIGVVVVLVELVKMAREAWARRGELPDRTIPAGGSPTVPPPVTGGGFRPLASTYWGLVVTVAIGVAGLIAFYPPLNEASEVSVKYHHLIHATQFFAGAFLAAAIGSAAGFRRRFPGGMSGGLIVAILAPIAMLLVMIPLIYDDLLDNNTLHGAYHLVMLALGLLTGLGASMLGRVAGWAVIATSVGMALLFAPGVGG